jgi:CubicO group peptidase (beta-lactamase class C family)
MADFVTRVSHLPLVFQPGTAWKYGVNLDLVGAVIEQVAGQPFEKVMQERVLHPLGMKETSFAPPPDAGRLAKIYQHDAKGLSEIPALMAPPFASGGGGLYSTLHDYARFAQMLLNGGVLDGNRVLGPKTVEMMSSNEVGYLNPRPIERYVPQGFGFAVRVQLDDRSSAAAFVSPGTYGWEGILTTYVSIDPHEHLILLSLLQHQPYDDGEIFERYSNTVYQAIVR